MCLQIGSVDAACKDQELSIVPRGSSAGSSHVDNRQLSDRFNNSTCREQQSVCLAERTPRVISIILSSVTLGDLERRSAAISPRARWKLFTVVPRTYDTLPSGEKSQGFM